MTEPVPTLTVVAYATVRHRRLLTVRKRGTAKFMFPGGKLQPGESHRQAVAREVQEELGCQVDPATVTYLGEFETAAANEPNTRLIAHVFHGALVGDPTPKSEIAELRWIRADEHPTDLAPLLVEWILPLLRDRAEL